MFTFLAERAASTIALVTVVSLATFAAGVWAPGNYEEALRLEPGYSASASTDLRARHHLDGTAAERLVAWAGSLLHGDLGVSVAYDAPVAPLVMARAWRTLLLGVVAAVVAWALAVPLGVLMAARPGSRPDRWTRLALATLLALPEPALAIALLMAAARTGWAPAGGMVSTHAEPGRTLLAGGSDLARHLAIPAGVLALGILPAVARHTRSSVGAVLGAPFVLAARARGVPESRVLLRGVLRAAAAPLASLFGLSIASLVSASLAVEVITGWPGLGPLLIDAVRARDLPVVVGVTLCSVVLLAVGTTVADVAGRLTDPRTRSPQGVGRA